MDNKFFRSIWFWWLLTTVIYVLLNITGYLEGGPSFMVQLTGFVGLFVPYGILSLILFVSPASWFSVVIFIAGMVHFEKKYNNQFFSLGLKILLNLLALLVLTAIVDLVRGTPFMSWTIFFNSFAPN